MALHDRMLSAYGEQAWWPADSQFEVVVGAVLAQNTNWSNVERAINNLKTAGVLGPEAILDLQRDELAELIRPSGYYNVKTKRLLALVNYLQRSGGLEVLAEQPLEEARQGLLSVNGIGPETADDILLYALDRPVFVIDTYTRRLLARNNLAQGTENYEDLRLGFEAALPTDVALFRQFHALIVQHAKVACRKLPVCATCCLGGTCPQSFK